MPEPETSVQRSLHDIAVKLNLLAAKASSMSDPAGRTAGMRGEKIQGLLESFEGSVDQMARSLGEIEDLL